MFELCCVFNFKMFFRLLKNKHKNKLFLPLLATLVRVHLHVSSILHYSMPFYKWNNYCTQTNALAQCEIGLLNRTCK
jgi:hypothetical protein